VNEKVSEVPIFMLEEAAGIVVKVGVLFGGGEGGD
jgi:hypothetical protein